MPKKIEFIELKNVFDIENENLSRGAWWWWWWIFFFDNPKIPEKPRQLMILWSAKNTKRINCNDLDIKIEKARDGNVLDGVVAAWYFDGERMHHNFLLEQCRIRVGERGLVSESRTPASFSVNGKCGVVKIGDDFVFVAEADREYDFSRPRHHSNNFVGEKGYSIMKVNRTGLKGRVEGKTIKGSAYFQRVFVNAPAIPWYWGIFHFESGGILTYTNQLVFGKSIKKDISFFDGNEMHSFKKMRVKRSGGDVPVFRVTGENEGREIEFVVDCYSHSWWTFRKKSAGVIPNKLTYNEYPAVISEFRVMDKKTGRVVGLKELGKAVGNAEHTTGYLL